VAVASAEVLSIAATRDGPVVSTVGGTIESPRAAGERWGRIDGAVATPIAHAEPSTRRLRLGRAADGALLVAVGASAPDAADGAVVRLVRADCAIAPWPMRDERMSDRVARIADPDPVRRAAAREAMLVSLVDQPAGREELAVAARAIARSHRDPATRREAMHLLARLDRMTAADLEAAASDPDPAVRRHAVRIAGSLGRRDLLLAGCEDGDPSVRVEGRIALVGASQTPAEMLALVAAIAADRRDDAALLVLRAAAWGREIEVLEALSSDAGGSVASTLVDALLERAAPSTRRLLLERSLDGRSSPTAAEATLRRMLASVGEFDRRPRRLPLDREPKGLAAAQSGPHAALVARLEPHLRWPGRPGIVEDASGVEELRAEGRLLYAQCAVCHGPAGLGQAGVYPSLVGSAIANGPPERFAKVLLHGLAGGRTAAGRPYAAQMPKAVVSSDEELAAIMTYVRSAFGNGAEPVDPALVSRVREAHRDRTAPWSAEELERP
jgi:mono/diheme cytochrome c family protein